MKILSLLVQRGVTDQTVPEESASIRYSRGIFLGTLGMAALLLLALELRWPYYFLQDDGLEEYLPAYFHNWRSLLAGKLPLYDFHIFAGMPHLAMGQKAVFYIPEYVAMFLSETIWGHPFATIGLMAFMHGLIAVAGGYILLRYLGVTDLAASFGALCALSGFFVWCGRMWPTALMLCAWFPWMVWASLRFLEKPSAARAGWLMFFRLGLLYGGHPQFFVLGMLFEHLFALSHSAAIRKPGWKSRCIGYVALDLPTALLGLPFLLPVWAAVGRSLGRSTLLPYAEFSSASISALRWVFGQLFVFVNLRLPNDYIASALPYLSYVGYIATLLPFGTLFLWKKHPRSRPWIVACGVSFFIALLWCWNVLGPLIYHLPVLNRFRWPFKLIYFAGFFQCILAALVLARLSKRWQQIALGGFIVNWIAVFCFLPNHAWDIRKYHPPLKSPWQHSLKDGRYVVISPDPHYFVSKEFVAFDYSALWGLDNLVGYDRMVPRSREKLLRWRPIASLNLTHGNYDGPVDQVLLDHLKKWSVKYVLVNPDRANSSAKLAGTGFHVRTVKGGWTLWQDPNALPRVRWGNLPPHSGSDGIRWVEHVNSIDVYLSQWPSHELVFAFAANPGLETCIGNECRAVGRSPDGLIRIQVPAGTRHVRLVYRSVPFSVGIWVALGTLVAYLLLLLRSLRRDRRESSYGGFSRRPRSHGCGNQ